MYCPTIYRSKRVIFRASLQKKGKEKQRVAATRRKKGKRNVIAALTEVNKCNM